MAFAADKPTLNAGDTAWMLTSTALVLLMTIPGLALFYGGMVRSKNVLSILMQCFAITCLVTILWALFGYSIAFGDGGRRTGADWARRSCTGSASTALSRDHSRNRVHVSSR